MSDSSDIDEIDEMLREAMESSHQVEEKKPKSRSHRRGIGSQLRRDERADQWRRGKAERQLLRESAFGGMECMSIFDPRERMDCMVGERGRGAVAVGRGAVAVGRANSSGSEGYQSALEEEEEVPRVVAAAEPPERLCDMNLDFELFVDPVVTAEGFTHSRRRIEEWFFKNDRSPDTNEVIKDKTLIPNILVRQMVDDWKQANPGYEGEGGFINKKARKSRRKSRNKKNRNRRTKSKSRN